MIRLTYRSATTGETHVEDLIGGSNWTARQYRAALQRQRPGIEILSLVPIDRAQFTLSTRPRFHIITRSPGRPHRSVWSDAETYLDAVRDAMRSSPPGSALVRCVPVMET